MLNGDVVFDCGACEGFFSYKIKDKASVVYCFEPNQTMAKCLKMTFANYSNIKIIEAALGERRQNIRFSGAGYAGFRQGLVKDDNAFSQTVMCTTIDDFVEENHLQKVDFIKVDVEGSESGLVRGAQNTIRRFRPKIAITTYHSASDASDLICQIKALVPDYKYRLCGIANKGVFKDEESYLKPRCLWEC